MATYQIIKPGVNTVQGMHLTAGGRGVPAGISIAGLTITVPDNQTEKINEAFVRTGWLRRIT